MYGFIITSDCGKELVFKSEFKFKLFDARKNKISGYIDYYGEKMFAFWDFEGKLLMYINFTDDVFDFESGCNEKYNIVRCNPDWVEDKNNFPLFIIDKKNEQIHICINSFEYKSKYIGIEHFDIASINDISSIKTKEDFLEEFFHEQ